MAATLGLLGACGGKYDVGSGEEGGAGGSEAGGSGGASGTAGGSKAAGGSEATGGVAGTAATGAGGSEAGTASGGFGGVDGGVAGSAGDGGNPGATCSSEYPTLEPFTLASPAVIHSRLARLIHEGELPPAAELPDEASVAWARELALELIEAQRARGEPLPGASAFLRDWAFGGDDANADFWARSFYGTFGALFDRTDEGRSSFLADETFLRTYRSPTPRGLWMVRELFCEEVPVPPPNIDSDPVPPLEGMTRRETLEATVSSPTCAGCHHITDPLGYSLEHYDELGQYRTTDNGFPVDASGTYSGPYGEIAFTSIDDLAPQLVGLCDVQRCFAQRAFENALERVYEGDPPAYDPAEIQYVHAQSAFHYNALTELVVGIATTPALLRE